MSCSLETCIPNQCKRECFDCKHNGPWKPGDPCMHCGITKETCNWEPKEVQNAS